MWMVFGTFSLSEHQALRGENSSLWKKGMVRHAKTDLRPRIYQVASLSAICYCRNEFNIILFHFSILEDKEWTDSQWFVCTRDCNLSGSHNFYNFKLLVLINFRFLSWNRVKTFRMIRWRLQLEVYFNKSFLNPIWSNSILYEVQF